MENYAALGYLLSQRKETAQDLHRGPSKSLYLTGLISEGQRGEHRKNSSKQTTHSTNICMAPRMKLSTAIAAEEEEESGGEAIHQDHP